MSNEDVNIIISGDSAPLVAAAADASAAFGDMAVAAEGASADIAASMADLAAAVDALSAEIDLLAASMDTLGGSSTEASAGIAEAGTTATITATEMFTLSDAVDMVTGALASMMGALGPLLVTAGLFVTVMAGWQILNDVANEVENLVQQMFALDKQTQRVVNSWQYLFALAPGGGRAAAQQLAGWAYQESPKLPFTAVDLRSAISTLGTIPSITPGKIEQFLPVLADIASTLGASDFGGQGINLQQAAQAIVGAQFGLTRQLRYELHINPDELLQYGLKGRATATGLRITDQSTLIPAIMRWAAHRGLTGAAQEQETTTFWGAFSSFQDYIQNILQTMGGIDPATGRVMPGSMFGGLQNLLISVNNMLAAGQTGGSKSVIGQIMGAGEQILGGGVTSGISLGGGILSGLLQGGAGQVAGDLFQKIKDFGEWLSSAPIQKDLHNIGQEIGQFFGENLKSAQRNLPDLVHALQDLGRSLLMLWNSVTPEQRKSLLGLAGDVIQVAAAITEFVSLAIQGYSVLVAATEGLLAFFTGWAGKLSNQFKTWGANFINMLIQGIQSAIPNLTAQLQHVADGIASHLGFHSPPREGVLATSDQWMPNMMNMFARGIEHGLPAVARASQQAAQAIAAPLHGGYGSGGVTSTVYGNTTNYGGTSPTLNMYGANPAQMNQLIEAVLQQLDRQHNVALQQAGGFGYRSFGPIG